MSKSQIFLDVLYESRLNEFQKRRREFGGKERPHGIVSLTMYKDLQKILNVKFFKKFLRGRYKNLILI